MNGAAASPSARGPSQPTGSSAAAAPKQLFDAAYKYALVATLLICITTICID